MIHRSKSIKYLILGMRPVLNKDNQSHMERVFFVLEEGVEAKVMNLAELL